MDPSLNYDSFGLPKIPPRSSLSNSYDEALDQTQNINNEMLQKIFSLLPKEARQTAASVSFRWHANLISQTKSEQSLKIGRLIQSGINCLEKEASELGERGDPLKTEAALNEISADLGILKDLLRKHPILKSLSLLQVKNNLDGLREPLAVCFRHLGSGAADQLKQHFMNEMPLGFEHFFADVDFHRQLSEANQKADPEERSKALVLLAKTAVTDNNLPRALALLPDISIESLQGHAFKIILKTLIAKGQLDRAVDLATHLPFQSAVLEAKKGDVLFFTLKVLFRKGHIDKAVDVANGVAIPGYRERMLQAIVAQLTVLGNVDKALKIASSEAPGESRDACHNIILKILDAKKNVI